MNPETYNSGMLVLFATGEAHIVNTQLKILIPVGTAITIVAAEKNDLESTSKPTVYMWCAQTIKPRNPIDNIAPAIPNVPKIGRTEFAFTMLLTIPNAGRIKT